MSELKFEIVDRIGVISVGRNGWSKEVNRVSWNGAEPKIDIRDWSADHSKMGKGLTFALRDAETLAMILHNYIAERSE